MSSLAVVASVLLGVAFLVAGGSKLALGAAWPEQARGLGAPAVVIPVVPWIELGLGALLVVQVARVALSMIALGLLVAFTALIVRQLAHGRHPPCACFGAWSATPIGWRHVARNVVLMALAVIAIAA